MLRSLIILFLILALAFAFSIALLLLLAAVHAPNGLVTHVICGILGMLGASIVANASGVA